MLCCKYVIEKTKFKDKVDFAHWTYNSLPMKRNFTADPLSLTHYSIHRETSYQAITTICAINLLLAKFCPLTMKKTAHNPVNFKLFRKLFQKGSNKTCHVIWTIRADFFEFEVINSFRSEKLARAKFYNFYGLVFVMTKVFKCLFKN